METAFKYAIILLVVLPMIFMIVVAVFSAISVFSDIPFRNRDR